MMPGMNPRAMKQAMRKMGIQQEEIDAIEVIIRTAGKDIIIKDPSVSIVKMMGQESFQISGKVVEESREGSKITEEDIKTVMEQSGADRETALSALQEANGGLAEAILAIQGKK